jgi:hypothetical protein
LDFSNACTISHRTLQMPIDLTWGVRCNQSGDYGEGGLGGG